MSNELRYVYFREDVIYFLIPPKGRGRFASGAGLFAIRISLVKGPGFYDRPYFSWGYSGIFSISRKEACRRIVSPVGKLLWRGSIPQIFDFFVVHAEVVGDLVHHGEANLPSALGRVGKVAHERLGKDRDLVGEQGRAADGALG